LALWPVETGMSRRFRLLASVLLAAVSACSQAYSDRASAQQPAVIARDGRAPIAAPYGFEVIGEDGRVLPTYANGGRFYVMGEQGQRYLIRITNPTPRRVEAVVTVDGLDVIDGEPGDLRKRGYVVPAGGDLEIEGFRTSTADVATFRFSAVDASYAGRKGKARNVGVIAVALFDEVAPQEIILEQRPADPPPVIYYDEESVRGYDGWGKAEGGGAKRSAPAAPPAAKRPASGGGSRGAVGTAEAQGDDVGAPSGLMQPPPSPPTDRPTEGRAGDPCCTQPTRRSGLGTEYGEQRSSAATWTRFVRASETPIATSELRYNDAAGLAALGIEVAPPVDPEEVTKRETADPFPGDPTFSRPPAGIR